MLSSIQCEETEVFTILWKACRQGNTRSSSRAVDAFEKNKKKFAFLFFYWVGFETFPFLHKTINSERIILEETETSNCVKDFFLLLLE